MKLTGNKQRQMIFILSFVLIIILLCAAIAAALSAGRKDNMRLNSGKKQYLEDGWISHIGTRTEAVREFPAELQAESVRFTNTLPMDLRDGDVFVFENSYQQVEVIIDGQNVYTYGGNVDSPYFMAGKINCFVELKPEYAGKQIEVCLSLDTLGSSIVFRPGYIAAASELPGNILKDNTWACLFCIATGSSVVIMFLFAFSQWVKKSKRNSIVFLYLGFFALSASLWVFTDSGLPQLIFSNSQMILILSFEVFMLMPVPLLSLIYQICQYRRKLLHMIKELFLVNFVVQNILYICKIAHFMQMIAFTHIIMVASVIVLVGCLIREWQTCRSIYAKWMLAAISIFSVMGCLSMIPFYKNNGENKEQFFIIGFLIFMLIMVMLALRKFQEYAELSARAQVLEELAFMDIMTGMGNRTLYEQQMEVYDCAETDEKCVSVLLFDVNDLKEVNDTYGHKEGDRLVMDAAGCIRQAYGKRGECYRIGGDEFVVILWGREIDPESYRDELDKYIKKCNVCRQVTLSMSAGCSIRCAHSEKKITLSRMVELADERMYNEKKRYHKEKEQKGLA